MKPNKIDELEQDMSIGEPLEEPQQHIANQEQIEGYKEMVQIELANGSKIMCGSMCRPVEVLADIVLQLKAKLLDNGTKKEVSYTG